MVGECCLKGFRWNGETRGREDKLESHPCYVTGNNPDAAVMIVTDLYGWTFPNTRLLADHYAEEAGLAVYIPDFFGGEILDFDILSQFDRRDWDKLDLPGFLSRNAKAIRSPEVLHLATSLKARYKRVGAVGFCYGGWAVSQLASGSHNPGPVDCIAFAHPSMLEKSEIDHISVPVQILAPEHDDQFTPELKAYALSTIPNKNVPFDYQYFPALQHAFAVRGDPSNRAEQDGMQRAKDAVVLWLRQWLK